MNESDDYRNDCIEKGISIREIMKRKGCDKKEYHFKDATKFKTSKTSCVRVLRVGDICEGYYFPSLLPGRGSSTQRDIHVCCDVFSKSILKLMKNVGNSKYMAEKTCIPSYSSNENTNDMFIQQLNTSIYVTLTGIGRKCRKTMLKKFQNDGLEDGTNTRMRERFLKRAIYRNGYEFFLRIFLNMQLSTILWKTELEDPGQCWEMIIHIISSLLKHPRCQPQYHLFYRCSLIFCMVTLFYCQTEGATANQEDRDKNSAVFEKNKKKVSRNSVEEESNVSEMEKNRTIEDSFAKVFVNPCDAINSVPSLPPPIFISPETVEFICDICDECEKKQLILDVPRCVKHLYKVCAFSFCLYDGFRELPANKLGKPLEIRHSEFLELHENSNFDIYDDKSTEISTYSSKDFSSSAFPTTFPVLSKGTNEWIGGCCFLKKSLDCSYLSIKGESPKKTTMQESKRFPVFVDRPLLKKFACELESLSPFVRQLDNSRLVLQQQDKLSNHRQKSQKHQISPFLPKFYDLLLRLKSIEDKNPLPWSG